jgi:hypothetical protein
MNKAITALPILANLCAGSTAGAEEPVLPRVGRYEVTVKVELPHIEDAGLATQVQSICVAAGDIERRGLPALSDLNPLRKCAASHVLWNGETLSFDIVCPGNDAAVGTARYTIAAERFDGAIAVKMGGKNMTMVERQSGRRVGDCR